MSSRARILEPTTRTRKIGWHRYGERERAERQDTRRWVSRSFNSSLSLVDDDDGRRKRQAFLCFSSSSLASSLPESPGVADSPAPPPCSVAMEREKRNRKQKNE